MFNDIIDVAVKGCRDIAAAVANAVVSDAVLWEVVGANFLAAITATNEVATFGGKLGIFFIDLDLQQT